MPPIEPESFLTFAQQLSTSTIYDAIRSAELLQPIAQFRLPEGVLRHFEKLERFPDGLLPIGDVVCKFNPLYGQGMSVAAIEALCLQTELARRRAEKSSTDKIAKSLFEQFAQHIDTPWSMALLSDLTYSQTRAERPPNFEFLLAFRDAILHLAVDDVSVQRLMIEVQQLLKPRSAYFEQTTMQRAMDMIEKLKKPLTT